MNLDEGEAIAGLEHVAAGLDVRLPPDVRALVAAALHWRDGDPRRNALAPGFAPLEYSFSTWQPTEFRVAAQLFAGHTPTQRLSLTVRLARQLAVRHLRAAPTAIQLPGTPQRFGAIFGVTADPSGLTGVETYVEAAAGDLLTSWLPAPLRTASRPAFTGYGVRADTVTRRGYCAVTRDLDLATLRACLPSDPVVVEVSKLLPAGILPAGTVVVTADADASVRSVDLHAPSYGLDLVTLPARLPGLRTAAFGRWAVAVGGNRALATVVSLRSGRRLGPGIAVYAVPAWACQQTSPTSTPTACPPCSTEVARAVPRTDPDPTRRARTPAT